MKKLNHPNIITLYEVIDDPEVDKLYLVIELAEGG
jgi:[calcium/calmodulin-dependent protein kinase] kinase